MSIEQKRTDVTTPMTTEQAPVALQHPRKRWYSVLRSPLWLCLLVALLIRVLLIYRTHGVIDGDEALVGIQAEHILRGEHPFYFYGQAYMGSLEAYLMAILFAIAGPSVWALRAEPALLSLGVVYLTWRLASALAEAAQLPPFAQQMFKTMAALLAAVSPLYDTVLELRTLGGYIETFVLMLLLLLAAFQLTWRWHAGAASKELGLRWAGIGLIVGLGIWVNPLLVSAIMAAGIWIGAFCVAEFIHLSRQTKTGAQRTSRSFLKQCLLLLVALPACMVGAAPALYWGFFNQWANFSYMLQLDNLKTVAPNIRPFYANQLDLIKAQISFYQTYIAPRVISGALPTENALFTTIHFFTFWLGLFCIAATSVLVVLSLFWRRSELKRLRQLGALPLLFASCTAFAFCTSTLTSFGLISFKRDLVGRYATPLMLVLPFFFATVFTLASMAIGYRGKENAANTEEVEKISARPAQRSVSARLRFQLITQGLIFTVLLVYLGAQAITFAATDPDATYQSPSCVVAPAYNDTIITYLQQEHVHFAWAVSWLANPIIFKTDGEIILADPRPIFQNQGLGRLPDYTEAVFHADRPSMLVFVRQTDGYPLLQRFLDRQQITYHSRRFPALHGFGVLVVTALSRTVSPYRSADFAASFPYCITL